MNNNKFERLPVIDASKCIDCEKCVAVCPENAIYKIVDVACAKCIKYCISMEVPCNPAHYIFCYDLCDACGKCVISCPSEVIHWQLLSK